MKVLTVSAQLPYEGVPHAGGEYLLRHLEFLAREHEITLMVPTLDDHGRRTTDLPDWLDVVPAAPTGRPDLGQQVERLRRRVRYRSLHASTLRGLRAAGLVERARAADLVELHWMHAAMLTGELRRAGVDAPIVVVPHDLEFEAAPSRRKRLHTGVPRTIGAAMDPVRRRMARRDLESADLILVFKPGDQELLRDAGVTTPSMVLSPNIEMPRSLSSREQPEVLFTGAMWRPENDHGVRWFLESVWPSVRAAVEGASFTIAGAAPSRSLLELAARTPGVVVTGHVESLAPQYRDAAAFVAPLFVAGGLKFKVVQAMAYGLPVVLTHTAAAGIVDVAPQGVVWAVTDDPGEMADSLIRLLRHLDESRAVGDAAAAWVGEAFSFQQSMETVLRRYRELADR